MPTPDKDYGDLPEENLPADQPAYDDLPQENLPADQPDQDSEESFSPDDYPSEDSSTQSPELAVNDYIEDGSEDANPVDNEDSFDVDAEVDSNVIDVGPAASLPVRNFFGEPEIERGQVFELFFFIFRPRGDGITFHLLGFVSLVHIRRCTVVFKILRGLRDNPGEPVFSGHISFLRPILKKIFGEGT